MKYYLIEPIGCKFLKYPVFLFLSILSLTVNCKKEETYPIPSFCAAESDWGPNNLIVFVNEPWEIIPPETPIPHDSVGLWTVKSDGSEIKFLTQKTPDGIEFYGAPEWSPDGKWIAANDRIGRIWMVSADGDSFVKITQQGKKFWPSFSPDGKKIAFSTPGTDGGLRILDLETGIEKFVYPYGAVPSWSPDGSKLVFSGSLWQGNRWVGGLMLVDTSGENAEMVHEEDGAIDMPSFSPDGSKVVFCKPYVYTNDITNIWVVNVNGSSPQKLTKKGGEWPSWSPDGKKIVYTRISHNDLTQEGSGDLYIINADGSGEKRLTFFYPR
ncbi:MAG: hypothetical protein OEZ20_04225 [candidate division WOR-3 bacterium]|nr:hypothetical protein [candidate division WOR-3 bacterium]MDH5683653.1 hypothetical protein [candidate division WOR-3 bacterium]